MSTPTPPKSTWSSSRRPTPPKILTTIRSMHYRRNAPPPIPIPINSIRHDIKATQRLSKPRVSTTVPVEALKTTHQEPQSHTPIMFTSAVQATNVTASKTNMVPVELSNYPPSLSPSIVVQLFSAYTIAPDFHMPSTTKFAYPLRTIIWIHGRAEAERAVRELDGTVVGGRRIRVTLAGEAEKEKEKENVKEEDQHLRTGKQVRSSYQEEKRCEVNEVVESEMVDELKIAILHTAHTYHPDLRLEALQVCEYAQGTAHYAFLQARSLEAVLEGSLAHDIGMRGWRLIASACENGRGAHCNEESERLGALKRLKGTVEEQGMLKFVWERLSVGCNP